ncbi:MAG: VOC family protein [Candidatus Limnocylindria bacterium]
MTARITSVILDCSDGSGLARFWAQLLGTEIEHEMPDFIFLRGLPDQPRMGFQPVPEPKTVKNRMHVDITVEHMAETVAWIEANGGRTLRENAIGDFRWTTVADPEGNEFDVHE